jgi:hypothetical protein
MRKYCGYILLQLLVLFVVSCNAIWGDHSLGNNLSLLEGDKTEDRIIVYCSGRSWGVCFTGITVIPVYNRQYDSNGNYAEYVESAKSNSKWVIVKTYQKIAKQENYWIISKDFNLENVDCSQVNCDSILQSHVKGPMTQTGFRDTVHLLNIGLDFK